MFLPSENCFAAGTIQRGLIYVAAAQLIFYLSSFSRLYHLLIFPGLSFFRCSLRRPLLFEIHSLQINNCNTSLPCLDHMRIECRFHRRTRPIFYTASGETWIEHYMHIAPKPADATSRPKRRAYLGMQRFNPCHHIRRVLHRILMRRQKRTRVSTAQMCGEISLGCQLPNHYRTRQHMYVPRIPCLTWLSINRRPIFEYVEPVDRLISRKFKKTGTFRKIGRGGKEKRKSWCWWFIPV